MSYQVAPLSQATPLVSPVGKGPSSEFLRWVNSLLSLVRFSNVPLYGIVLYSLTEAEEAAYFDATTGVGLTGKPWAGFAQTIGQTLTIDGVSRTLPVMAAAAMRIY